MVNTETKTYLLKVLCNNAIHSQIPINHARIGKIVFENGKYSQGDSYTLVYEGTIDDMRFILSLFPKEFEPAASLLIDTDEDKYVKEWAHAHE